MSNKGVIMPKDMKKKGKAKMSQSYYESTMSNLKPGGGKYSSDNVKELSNSVAKLGSYVKSHKSKY